jgi:hypothetical protein
MQRKLAMTVECTFNTMNPAAKTVFAFDYCISMAAITEQATVETFLLQQ